MAKIDHKIHGSLRRSAEELGSGGVGGCVAYEDIQSVRSSEKESRMWNNRPNLQGVGDGRGNPDAIFWAQCVLCTRGCNDKL